MNKTKGKVSLVGAGPGDPGLLTLKAKQLIQEADLIVYDYLANPQHLRHAKNSAVKICVGKGFRHRLLSQEKINRLIIREAHRGKHVVRLKGGDPYLFGRGAEEALHLVDRKIPFEVVPGVTSATACAAYSGIPLTHREHNSSVTFLTGHRADDENLDTIDWGKIVALNGTIVIYMGFYNLAKIADRLIENGMPPTTPAAVIEWGTLPRQKTCAATLATIHQSAAQQSLKAPAIIIIGDVVSLRERLNWYERLPLFGKKIVVTRTQEKTGVFAEKLSALGAEVLEFPTIEIQPLSNFKEMDRAIRNLKNYDWLVFTSVYGVEAFFDRLQKTHQKDARFLSQLKIAVVGPETKNRLLQYGISPDLFPKRYETLAIVEAFKKRFPDLKNKRILLVRARIAPPALETGLKKLGGQVSRVAAYNTKFPKGLAPPMKDALKHQKIDFVTFTSSSTVENFIKILGLKQVKKMAKTTRFASIGPVTSKTLRRYGLKAACEAKVFTTEGLAAAIQHDAVQRKNK